MSAITSSVTQDGMRIYRNTNTVEVPHIDLPSLVFDSEHSLAEDDTPLHLSAANPNLYLTKAALRALAERIAHFLRHTFSIGAQGPYKDVVVVCSSGQPAAPAAFWGIMASGGVFSAASHRFTQEELARQIKQGKSGVLIVSRDKIKVGKKAARLAGLALDRVVVLQSEPNWAFRTLEGGKQADTANGPRLTWRRVTDAEELKRSLIVLLYSSGTTGVPKGVMLSHYNMVSQLFIPSMHNRAHVAAAVARGEPAPAPFRTLAHVPIAHIAGVHGYLIAPMFSGGAVYWMTTFSWKRFLQHFKELKITIFWTVPSIFLRIAKDPEVTDQFDAVEVDLTGAAPMNQELQQAANAKMGKGNVKIGATWGLSETAMSDSQ